MSSHVEEALAARELSIQTHSNDKLDTGYSEVGGVCGLCMSMTSRYVCPRCGVRYCGLECYRGSGTCRRIAHPIHCGYRKLSHRLVKYRLTSFVAYITGHAECSEEFYKAEVVKAMQTRSASDAERQRMAAVLRQFEEQEAAAGNEDDPDGVMGSLDERLADLDLDDPGMVEHVWEHLTQVLSNRGAQESRFSSATRETSGERCFP